MNYYKVLGVPHNATDAQIGRAYRQLARQVHPDKNKSKSEEANANMKLLNEAKDVLCDPELRKQHDTQLMREANTRNTYSRNRAHMFTQSRENRSKQQPHKSSPSSKCTTQTQEPPYEVIGGLAVAGVTVGIIYGLYSLFGNHSNTDNKSASEGNARSKLGADSNMPQYGH